MARPALTLALCVLALSFGVAQAARAPSLGDIVRGDDGSSKKLRSGRTLDFPDSYEVEYTFTMPYCKAFQPDGLTYPVHVWVDGEDGYLRLDTYDGMVSTISTPDAHAVVSPHGDKMACRAHTTAGPASHHDRLLLDSGSDLESSPKSPGLDLHDRHFAATHGLLAPPLDKAAFHPTGEHLPQGAAWELISESVGADGVPVDLWEFNVTIVDKHNHYKFWVTKEGVPVKLQMLGTDIFNGAHYDEYVAEFTKFSPGRPDREVFELPELCEGQVDVASWNSGFDYHGDGVLRNAPLPISVRSAALHGMSQRGDAIYEEFMAKFGVKHDTPLALEGRAMAFHHNRRYIEEHNANAADAKGYTLGINHLADLSDDEFERGYMPNNRLRADPDLKGRRPHVPKVEKHHVPSSIDWRGTGADGPVMDQATCGSCYAFSAASAMRSAWYMATGEVLVLSEQQIVDCTWEYGNAGCGGGNYEGAVQYIMDTGGAYQEADYEYLGVDSFCKTPKDMPETVRPATFDGFVDIESGDVDTMKEALLTRGPLAISLNANPKSFRFYASGVLDDQDCTGRWEDLDHAVILVGYGTSEDGKDYWIVKNSWSTHYGDKGYILVTRDLKRDCGINMQAMYAIAAQPGAAQEPFDASDATSNA